jgi:RHS repeat-associated protein
MKPHILTLILLAICFLVSIELSAQSTNQNYIVNTAPTVEVSEPSSLTDDNSNTTIQYFDGLGRPSQTIQRAITPSKADLVNGIEYDDFGRDYRHWLPGSVSANAGAYVPDFGTPAVNTNGGDTKPYATTEYDGSPLNRVTGQYGAGAAWYAAPGKKKTISYTSNGSDVKYFYVEGSLLKCNSTYTTATLYGQKTTDEDGKTVEEFTDKQGHKVLSRVAGDHDTYYVYDDLGNLRYVLPPMAADALGTNTTGFDEGLGSPLYNYCYIYRYDGQKRCTEKKLPGCEPILMVYDLADRLVASQDGNQKSKGQWTVNKYDAFNRLLYSYIATKTQAEMASAFGSTHINETLGTNNTTGGYTLTGDIPVTAMLTVNYYDSYDFRSLSGNNPDGMLTNTTLSDYTNPDLSYTKALLTGTRVYHLDNPSLFEVTAIYYDKYGRIVQSRSTNHLNGYDITYNALDFTGKPTKTLKTHGINGATPSITELYTYEYDKAQRLKTTTHQLNGGSVVTLASNSYDELGRVTSTLRHNNADNCSYDYNIRNWPTKITSGTFEENLYYNSNLPSGASANYNGNIAYSSWTYNGVNKGYAYDYDDLNRVTSANFKQGSSSQSNDSYNESLTYDKMGNILTLQRKKDNVLIDDLVLHYKNGEKSNQIDWINDSKLPIGLNSVKEYQNNSTATSNEFAYDVNGNMVKDLDRNIVAIQYNVLNLPDVIQFKNGNQIKNTYDAGGHKLGSEYFTQLTNITPLADEQIISQSYNAGTVDQTGNAYIGSMEYKTQNGNSSLTALSRIYNDEGYVENPSNPQYHYYRKDHLGDNREVWLANTGETVQRTQYYPSGLPWASNTGDNPGKQQRKYNGKEFVEMHGYDTYDYGARGMYPAIGGFMTVDPLAEDYYETSPYAYCLNNPVNKIDPDGRGVNDVNPLPEITVTAKKNNPVGTRAMNPVSGFWGWVGYFAFDRTYRSGENSNGGFPVIKATWNVNSDGIVTGVAPLTGTVDVGIAGEVGTYLKLRSLAKSLMKGEFEVHHLAEARHLRRLFKSTSKAPSVILTKSEHLAFTKDLRKALPYNKAYTKVEIIEAYKVVYKNQPEWLKVAIDYINK